MADERIIVMTVECPRCKTEQNIHVAFRTGFGQMAEGLFHYLNRNNRFKVTVPRKIMDGPFPA